MSSQWRSRRLAARALKVLERHRGASPAVAAFDGPLGTSARTYIAAYTEATGYKVRWRIEMDEGRGSMRALEKEIGLWKPHVARERPGFEVAGIGDKPAVPEDLVEDALALAEELREVRDERGATAPWAAAAAATITEKATIAERETNEAAAADSRYTALLQSVRESQAVFDAELIRFRATLRALLGSSHPDFQKLRERRAAARDVDDDPAGPPAPEPVTPAPEPPSA